MEKSEEKNNPTLNYQSVYGDNEEAMKAAQKDIEMISNDYENREQPSVVFNGISYSDAYAYNQQKAVNYAPPRDTNDDRQVSLGLVHEKIMGFVSIFLKYVFKKEIIAKTKNGVVVDGLGRVYELATEMTFKLERFWRKLPLIYQEVYTQGDAFVLDDWIVADIDLPKVLDDNGNEVDLRSIDMTYEALENLKYSDEKARTIQKRFASARLLDGRSVILADLEIEDIQEQPHLTIEDSINSDEAEAMYGSLKMWDKVPKNDQSFSSWFDSKIKLFDQERKIDFTKKVIRHRLLDKQNNRMQLFLNGVAMLPHNTPMHIWYPRLNYPIVKFSAERIPNCAYSRAVPAKLKFNADFADWILTKLAYKFEQGSDPAIITKGRHTITKKIFRGGQVTHGLSRDMFEKADPDNKGVTAPEFSFANLIKDIMEKQTINPTTSGELSAGATATEIATVENNQREQLGNLLDGLTHGWVDMILRRCETIESKYMTSDKTIVVDGKEKEVYHNFTVNMDGVDASVVFDESISEMDEQQIADTRGKLFKQSFEDRKAGKLTESYLVDPKELIDGNNILYVNIRPEKKKDTYLQMIQMWEEFGMLLQFFPDVDREALKEEYLQVTGRKSDLFLPKGMNEALQSAQEQTQQGTQNTGSFGKPDVGSQMRQESMAA